MPYNPVKLTLTRLLFVVAASLLLCAPLAARDMSRYAEYLGNLRMFEEAERILRKQIETGNAEEKAAARISLARIIKQRADDTFQRDGKESERDRLYDEAQKVFGESPKEGAEKVELAVIRMELSRTLSRNGNPRARGLAELANTALKEEAKRLEDIRNNWKGAGVMEDDKVLWPLYVRTGYQYCYSFYVLSLTYARDSADRRTWIGKCTGQIDEFQFSVGVVCVELLDSMILKGDLQIALGMPENSVNEFLSVPSYLSNQPVNYIVGYHSLRGYLRAAEVLTSELGDDPANLQRVKQLYLEAWAKFGKETGLATDFKRFRLHRISAMIKLGEDMENTVKDLFALAADPDAGFRRQALTVLAEISTRPSLAPDVRFRCAREVARFSEDAGQLLRVAQAFQALLAQCSSVEQFEMYAPAAYSRIGDIYERLFRFLDASIVYREAAYRTGYFRKKFGGADETQPEAGKPMGDQNKHMQGMCDLITDSRSAYDFPLNMAKAFLKVTKWLTSNQWGDPNNDTFKKLFNEANEVVAAYGDQDQVFENMMRLASVELGKGNWAQAAVRYLKIPSGFKKYHLCLDNAARCYRELANIKTSPRINRRGNNDEVESDEFFAEQRARHERDLERLPRNLWEGIDARHWDVIQESKTEGDLANWHKAAYYYQKYFLFLIMREWERISKRVEPEKADWVDCFLAMCESKHEDWMKLPAAQRKADPELRRLALSAYNFVCQLRVAPGSMREQKDRDALEAAYRPMAVKLLRRMMTLFEPHFRLDADLPADELKLNREYTQSLLEVAFNALVDDEDADGCESVLTEYRTRFNPAAEKDEKAKKALQTQIFRMIQRVYSLFLKVYDPRTKALNSASTNLRSRFNQMKLGLFVDRIGPKYPEAAKRLDEAKGMLARDKALAQHFWEDWLVKATFEATEHTKNMLAPELSVLVKAKWDELAESYPTRWGKAMRQAFNDLLKTKDFASIQAEAETLLKAAKDTEVCDKLQERAKAGDSAASTFSQLATQIYLNTGHLRYFTGTVFIYEFGGFLDGVANDLDSRLRPLMTKILTYYQMYQEAKKEDSGVATDLKPEEKFNLGKQYFRVRDWDRAILYLQPYYDHQEKAKAWGDRGQVAVNAQLKKVGLVKSGEEMELCYQLGAAYFQRFKANGSADDLARAAPLMRRAYSFVQVRNANEMAKNQRPPYELSFKEEMENYYLDVVEGMAEIYLALHGKPAIKVDFLPAADQFQASLEPKQSGGKIVMQRQPADEPSYLWESRRIRLDTWGAFYRLDDHPWRSEFRTNVMAWVQLTTAWVKKYGKEGKGMPELPDFRAIKAEVQQVLTVARQTGTPTGHFEDDGTLAWKALMIKAHDELEAAAKTAGILQ